MGKEKYVKECAGARENCRKEREKAGKCWGGGRFVKVF